MTRAALKIAVFASGGGTNFQALLDAVEAGTLPAEVVLCLSNKAEAGALRRAESHGVPTSVLVPEAFPEAETYTEALLETLETHGADFIALAGYLKMIPAAVVQQFRNRMVNIHPSLLPAFGGPGMYGRRVHRAALDYGVRWTGVTVHLVDEAYDTGPIVLQEPVPVYQDDTPEALAARVLEVEHRLYPEALRLFADGRITVEGRRVRIAEPSLSPEPCSTDQQSTSR